MFRAAGSRPNSRANQASDASIHAWCGTPTGQSALVPRAQGGGVSGSLFIGLLDGRLNGRRCDPADLYHAFHAYCQHLLDGLV